MKKEEFRGLPFTGREFLAVAVFTIVFSWLFSCMALQNKPATTTKTQGKIAAITSRPAAPSSTTTPSATPVTYSAGLLTCRTENPDFLEGEEIKFTVNGVFWAVKTVPSEKNEVDFTLPISWPTGGRSGAIGLKVFNGSGRIVNFCGTTEFRSLGDRLTLTELEQMSYLYGKFWMGGVR